MSQWYYGEAGQQVGPFDGAEILRRKADGRIQPDTLVWRQGMLQWQQVSQLADDVFLAPQAAYVQSAMAASSSGWAIASMVCGIVSLLMCYFGALAGIPGVVFGHIAMNTIRKSPYPIGGRGMAIAGLVTGYLGILVSLASAGFVIFAVVSARSHGLARPHSSPPPMVTPAISP